MLCFIPSFARLLSHIQLWFFFVGASPAPKPTSGSLNRRSEGRLESKASREAIGSEALGPRGDRGPPSVGGRGGAETNATISVVMSAESAQRLKAQAAESGLHQSDSGLASESHLLLVTHMSGACLFMLAIQKCIQKLCPSAFVYWYLSVLSLEVYCYQRKGYIRLQQWMTHHIC